MYIEATFEFVADILKKLGHVTCFDSYRDELEKTIKRGIDLFFWLYSKCKWITTPTTFDTFLSFPFDVQQLLYRNKEKEVVVCLKDLLDQETENNVKVMKDRFKTNNNKKHGQCKIIMNSNNFAAIGKLVENQLLMKYDNDANKKGVDQNKWFYGKYKTENYDDFSKKTMESFRELKYEHNEDVDKLYNNQRVRDLEQMISEHEAAKCIDDDDDSEDDEKCDLPQINSNNNNKNKKIARGRGRGRGRNKGRGRGQKKVRKPGLRSA